MINDIIFSKSFNFGVLHFTNSKHTDNREGIQTHYFAYMTSGSGRIVCENETVNVNKGDVFYLPRGLKYQSYWSGEPKIEFVSLGFIFMPNSEDESYGPQVIALDTCYKDDFYVIAEAEKIDPEVIGRFYTLTAQLMKEMKSKEKNSRSRVVSQAKAFLTEDPYASVRDVARALSVSESLLYLSFKKYSDISIGEYKSTVVLEKARELLISTDMQVEEISSSLGISSSSYFRKSFKKHFGITPREMRRRHTI